MLLCATSKETVENNKELLVDCLTETADAPASLDEAFTMEESCLIEFSKPVIYPIEKEEFGKNLRKRPGFEDVEIEDIGNIIILF